MIRLALWLLARARTPAVSIQVTGHSTGDVMQAMSDEYRRVTQGSQS